MKQWWRYPFAVAGPLSVTAATLISLTGVASALVVAQSWGFFPGALAFVVSFGGIRLTRSRFMQKRDIVLPKIRKPARRQVAGGVAGAGPFVVVIALGWRQAWIWPLFAASFLVYEAELRWRWARRGYAGDPRWARDWSPEADPAYKFRALSFLISRRYEEARQLLQKALETEPGDPALLYNVACAEALAGDRDAAIGHVIDAASLDARLRKRARTDPDLASIRNDPRFPR
jgi:hypothetical protein